MCVWFVSVCAQMPRVNWSMHLFMVITATPLKSNTVVVMLQIFTQKDRCQPHRVITSQSLEQALESFCCCTGLGSITPLGSKFQEGTREIIQRLSMWLAAILGESSLESGISGFPNTARYNPWALLGLTKERKSLENPRDENRENGVTRVTHLGEMAIYQWLYRKVSIFY